MKINKYIAGLLGVGIVYFLFIKNNKKKGLITNYYNIDKAVEFIKKSEGFFSNAYYDFKQISIGYGSKAKNKNETITKEQATQRLIDELEPLKRFLINKSYKINNNQFNALLSFIYNVGPGGLNNTGLNSQIKINPNDKIKITSEFNKWIYAGGKINTGLKNRRNKEIELYFS